MKSSTMGSMRPSWNRVAHLFFGVLVVLIACLPANTQTAPSAPEDGKALDAATQAMCKTQVAMVGEIATHGDGHTLAFKVALVQRLINQCGFDTVLFEANQEEFIHLNRRLRSGDAVTSNDLLTAVGGIWKFYREFEPLAPFLLTRAQAGRVVLGGLDDQLGQLGQDYANIGMVTELTNLLPEPYRQACDAALHKRIYSEYPESAPYSEADRSQIDQCLAAMQATSRADSVTTALTKQEQEEMISATRRWVSRDFQSEGESMANRDRSMFETFEWLQSRLPKRHKVIVWAATVHIAKQGSPIWGDHAGTNLGSLIHRKYGSHARSLGFSAAAGSFGRSKGNVRTLPVPPSDSVEAQALQGTLASAVYVGSKQLAAMGVRPGAFFIHSYQTLAWSAFLDGVVVFQTERPPTDSR
jgi:erythromycin esterase-like protein